MSSARSKQALSLAGRGLHVRQTEIWELIKK